MYSGWAFVDVDGTIIDENDRPRPYIKELIETLYNLNLVVVIWSGGGDKYAEDKFNRACYKIGHPELLNYVSQYLWKANKIEWSHIRPVFFVDDSEYIAKEHEGEGFLVFRLPFYHETTMGATDKWLLGAANAAERFFADYNKGGEKKVNTNPIRICCQ